MSLAVAKLPDLVTTAGGSASSAIAGFDDAWALSISSTAASFTSTAVTVAVCWTSSGTDFVSLMSGDDTVLVFPAATRTLSPTPWKQVRVNHSGAEGSELTFHVLKTIVT